MTILNTSLAKKVLAFHRMYYKPNGNYMKATIRHMLTEHDIDACRLGEHASAGDVITITRSNGKRRIACECLDGPDVTYILKYGFANDQD